MIYFHHVAPGSIYLLTVYAKSQAADLTEEEKKQWSRFVDIIKRGGAA